MIVVSDTSSISNLIQINRVELLRYFYKEIIITPAVEMELSRIPKNKNFVSKAHWITIRPPKDLSKVKELCKQLDLGESESIALALELKTDLILMDEYLGRELATMHKLKVIGIIGVLIRAKQEDLIASLKTEIQKLKAVGFRINIKLETMIIDKFDV